MAKSLFDKQKNEIIKSFTNGVSIDQLAEKYNFTKITISRNYFFEVKPKDLSFLSSAG